MSDDDKKKQLTQNDLDAATEQIRQAASEGRIVFAPSDEVEIYQAPIDRLMDFIGIEMMFMSDDSCLCDFAVDAELLDAIREEFGIAVEEHDRIVDIAKRMVEAGV